MCIRDRYMTGFGTVAAMVKAMHDELGITVPVALQDVYKRQATMRASRKNRW